MSAFPLNDRRQVWLMMYATRSFEIAKEAADYIQEHSLQRGDPIFYPLFTSIGTNYARPFKRNRVVGPLTDKVVPKKYIEIHKELISLRDTFFAHSDGDGPQQDWGPINQMRYTVSGKRIDPGIFEIEGNPFGLQKASELCGILMGKMMYHVNKINRKYRDAIPRKSGEYMLNILTEGPDILIPVKPIQKYPTGQSN